MELVDILVLGTSAERRAGSNPAEGIIKTLKVLYKFVFNEPALKDFFTFSF